MNISRVPTRAMRFSRPVASLTSLVPVFRVVAGMG